MAIEVVGGDIQVPEVDVGNVDIVGEIETPDIDVPALDPNLSFPLSQETTFRFPELGLESTIDSPTFVTIEDTGTGVEAPPIEDITINTDVTVADLFADPDAFDNLSLLTPTEFGNVIGGDTGISIDLSTGEIVQTQQLGIPDPEGPFSDEFLFGLGSVLNEGYSEIKEFFGETEDPMMAKIDEAIDARALALVESGEVKLADLISYQNYLETKQDGFSLNPLKWGAVEWTIASLLFQAWSNRENQKFQQKLQISAEDRADERASRQLQEQVAAEKELISHKAAAEESGGGAVTQSAKGGLA